MTEIQYYTFTFKVLPKNVATVSTRHFFVSGWASEKRDENGYVTYSGFTTDRDLEKVTKDPLIEDFRYENKELVEKRLREQNNVENKN